MLVWIWTGIAITGAILNARQSILGFYLWVVSNTGLVIHNILIAEISQAILFGVYTGISSYGIWKWRKLSKTKQERK